jgi:hypothetical protein
MVAEDAQNMLIRFELKEPLSSVPSVEWLFIFIFRMVAQWLRHYATNRKVAGSIPDEVNF